MKVMLSNFSSFFLIIFAAAHLCCYAEIISVEKNRKSFQDGHNPHEVKFIRNYGSTGTQIRYPSEYVKFYGDKDPIDGSYNFISFELPSHLLMVFRDFIEEDPELFPRLYVSVHGSQRNGVLEALKVDKNGIPQIVLGRSLRKNIDFDLISFQRLDNQDQTGPISILIPEKGERYRELHMLCPFLDVKNKQFSCFVSSALSQYLIINYQLPMVYLRYWHEFDNAFHDFISQWVIKVVDLEGDNSKDH